MAKNKQQTLNIMLSIHIHMKQDHMVYIPCNMNSEHVL